MAITNVAFVKRADLELESYTMTAQHPSIPQPIGNKLDLMNDAVAEVLDIFKHNCKFTANTNMARGSVIGGTYRIITDKSSTIAILDKVVNLADGVHTEYYFRRIGGDYFVSRAKNTKSIHHRFMQLMDLIPPKGISLEQLKERYTYVIGDSMYSLSSSIQFFGAFSKRSEFHKKGDIFAYAERNGHINFYRAIKEPRDILSFTLVKLTKDNGVYNSVYLDGFMCTHTNSVGVLKTGRGTTYIEYIPLENGKYKKIGKNVCITYFPNTTYRDVNYHANSSEVDVIDYDTVTNYSQVKHQTLIRKGDDLYTQIITPNPLKPNIQEYKTDIHDKEYFELIDDKFGWNYLGKANPWRLTDDAIDTFTETNSGGCMTFKIKGDCMINFVNLEKAHADDMKLEILDKNGFTVERIQGKPKPKPLWKEYEFYNCCTTTSKCEYRLEDYGFTLKKDYDSTHKVRLCTKGVAIAGSLFAGKILELPCVDANLTTRVRLPKEPKTNEITGIREIKRNKNIKFRETNLIIYFEDVPQTAQWFLEIEELMDEKVYFYTSFEYTDPKTKKTDTRFDFLGHSGFLEDVALAMESLSLSVAVRQYNNG